MAMNRFVGLGILALSSMAASFAACNDSTTAVATGGVTGSGGIITAAGGNSGVVAAGGNSGVAKGGNLGTGGVAPAVGGAAPATGGGGAVTPGACTAATNILGGDLGASGNWIGGDGAVATDDVCGVQGAVYGYGDGSSCTVPTETQICTTGKCKISGTTKVDTTYAAWGCGIGIDLKNSGAPANTANLYAGPAKGFVITTSGDLGGLSLRVQYKTNTSDTIISPFKEFTTLGALTVLFSDVTCPTWDTAVGCKPVSGTGPYALQVQVVGATLAATYSLSIDSITPIL